MTTLVGSSFYFHDFFFLGGREVFDLLGFGVGELFELVERALLVVFADFLLFFQFLDGFLDIAADIADGRAVILEDFVDVLDELLAPVLGKRGNGHADHFTVVLRIEAEIGELATREENLESRIGALESREDEVYTKWRDHYHKLRYQPPNVEVLFDATLQISQANQGRSC